MVILTGCSSTHHAATPPVAYPLVSDGWAPGQQSMTALRQGPFHARLVNGTACAWVGDQATIPTEWPAGWTVTFNPTRLRDPAGKVAAVDGQMLNLGGGEITTTVTAPACGVSPGARVWAVTGSVK